MKRIILCQAFILMSIFSIAQSPETLKIRQYRQQQEHNLLNEFMAFLSIPNVAADSLNIRRNAAFIMEMMKNRGIQKVQLLEAKTGNVPPVVYGEVAVPGAKETIIFYAHYDGQPVNPKQWQEGLAPFTPALYSAALTNNGKHIVMPPAGTAFDPSWRIYARGASDDKAGVAAILFAYEALTRSGTKPAVNLKFFFEGEEEAGSPHLHEILENYQQLLSSDCWIICDGPVHQSGKKLIAFGVRGDARLDLTVYGSKRPLHSGHYGNWAPNPAMMLAKLLASMKDDNGMVTIKGFYDDVQPLTANELKALKEVPRADEQMKDELGIRTNEIAGKSLMESINLPSLNINGFQSANVGPMATNVIPAYATAVLDLRLVLGNDWKKQQQKVIDHVRLQGYTVLDHDPTDAERKQFAKLIKIIPGDDGYNAQRTSMSLPITKKITSAVNNTTSEQVVLLPTVGGSLPLFVFEKYLKANTITVSIANHDNNQHAENENIRLQNFWNGIETLSAIMLMK